MADLGTVLVTGGGGYVGAVLVPKLLEDGYSVRVLDLFLYGEDVLSAVKDHPKLEVAKGDLRDAQLVARAVQDIDAVVHLACISNDPSFELNPELGKSINYDAFLPLVQSSKAAGVKRFIYASSSSVYGVSEVPDVTEEHPLKPLTDYSKFKGMCEPELLREASSGFVPVIIRPATVFGYSPRQRLDLVVNILTNHAVNRHKITAFGGTQKRPNIHIEDMADVYRLILEAPDHLVGSATFNVGHANHTISELASSIKSEVEQDLPGHPAVEVVTSPTDDKRSYHISSAKIQKVLGYTADRTIENGVHDLVDAFLDGRIVDPMDNPAYFNIQTMKDLELG